MPKEVAPDAPMREMRLGPVKPKARAPIAVLAIGAIATDEPTMLPASAYPGWFC